MGKIKGLIVIKKEKHTFIFSNVFCVQQFFWFERCGVEYHEGKNNEKRRKGATVGYAQEEKRKGASKVRK